MTDPAASRLPIEPWCVREIALDLGRLGQMESLFALSNGHIGLRGNLDEGEPNAIPGTYLGSFYEQRPLPYAEPGYGYPEAGQSIVNVTNGKLIRLLADDSPFDIRYGQLVAHERTLDLRAGVLRRSADWQSPAGSRVRVRSTRMVSFTQRAVAAIAYEVEPAGKPTRIIVQSQLVANEAPPAHDSADPRVSTALNRPLIAAGQDVHGTGALLLHRARASGLLMAAGMNHQISAPSEHAVDTVVREDLARTTVVCTLRPGQRLRLVKYLGYGWSAHRSETAVRDQVAAALAGGGTSAGMASAARNTSISTSSGPTPTSRSMTPRFNRRCGSDCTTCCRPAPAPSGVPSAPKGSPVPVTTGTRSGIPRDSCCLC